MDFTNMKVKGIRCNIGDGTLTLTFQAKLTETNLETAQALAACGEDTGMDVSVEPMQLRMMDDLALRGTRPTYELTSADTTDKPKKDAA
jgi:hypothetical protein